MVAALDGPVTRTEDFGKYGWTFIRRGQVCMALNAAVPECVKCKVSVEVEQGCFAAEWTMLFVKRIRSETAEGAYGFESSIALDGSWQQR
jgi:hypothetical protein